MGRRAARLPWSDPDPPPRPRGAASTTDAANIITAYGVLHTADAEPPSASCGTARAPGPAHVPRPQTLAARATDGHRRVDGDTIAFGAPADETFLMLLDAGHDIGELTYVDRSVPILEVICQFVGTPTLSLVITLQGRMDGTEAFCTVESIEARPGPPTAAVVDVLEIDLLHQRQEVSVGKQE